jgi:hypothetical protein
MREELGKRSCYIWCYSDFFIMSKRKGGGDVLYIIIYGGGGGGSISNAFRTRIFKHLRSPRIDWKESSPLAYVAWRVATTTLFLLDS